MNADWAVAMGIFIIFVGWSFIYYFGFFPEPPDVSQGLDSISEKVMEFIGTEEHRMTVRYDSPDSGQGVLFADIGIPQDMEDGLGVFSGGSRLDCMLSGDRVYWEADLQAGENDFEIAFSDVDAGWCGDTLGTGDANQTFPLSAVRTSKVSGSYLSELQLVDYQAFRESIGTQSQVRLEWSGDAQGSYGPETPINRDVFVKEFSRPLMESGGTVDIRVLLWGQG